MARGCLALSTLLLLARAAVARVHPMSLGQPLVEPTEEDERLMWEEEERRSAELAVGPNSAWQQSSASLEENTAAVDYRDDAAGETLPLPDDVQPMAQPTDEHDWSAEELQLQQEQEQQQEDREAAAGQHWKETMAAALEDAHRLSAAAERLMEVRDETTVVAAAPAVVVPAPAVVWPQGEVVAQWLEAPDEPTASPPPPSVSRVTSRAPPPAGRLTVMRAEGNIPLMHRDPRVIGGSRPRSMRQAAEAGLLRPPPPRAAPPAWQHTEPWSAVPRTTTMRRSATVPAAAGALGWGPRLSVKSPPPPWLLGASHAQPPQAPLDVRTEEDWNAWAHAGEETQLGEEASEWGITELIDAGGDPADIAPPAVPRTQMVEQTPVWASAQAVLETETGRSMPHLSARSTAAAVAPTVPASAVAADVSTRVPLLRALAEHMRFYCGERYVVSGAPVTAAAHWTTEDELPTRTHAVACTALQQIGKQLTYSRHPRPFASGLVTEPTLMRLLRATGGTGAAGSLVALLTEHVARHGVEGRSAATVRMSGGDDAAALRYSRANEDFGEEPLNDTERPGVRTYTPRKRLGSRSPPWKGVWAHEVRAARHG